MSAKPGRNDPCWREAGSGKKYKSCHMKQDQQEAKKPVAPPPVPADDPRPLKAQSLVPTQNEPPARSPEEIVADAQAEVEWEQFEQADWDGKITLFQEKLESKRLDAEESFEMLDQIRIASDVSHSADARARFAEMVRDLRRDLPDVYRSHQRYYLETLTGDAIADQRWDVMPKRLNSFAEALPKNIEEFFNIIYALLYHGQIDSLFDAMNAAWSKVSAAHNQITPWGIEEFGSVLMQLVFYRYLETTPSPHPDDPTLIDALSVYMKPNPKWYETAIRHLSAPAPSPWRREDFGESVDAEQGDDNVAALLFEFMADQRRRADVPLSKSALMNQRLHQVLHQQFSEVPAKSRKPRGKSKQKRTPSTPVSSLIPQYKTLDRILVV
jgi:hypothetical protein